MRETFRECMSEAVRKWIIGLREYPGWRAWKRKQLKHTLYFDDPLLSPTDAADHEFTFDGEVAKQHDIILHYLNLEESIASLKECEFYFRRYPFRGLPVTRKSHITNICEMYFGRFYEFRERLKKYLNLLKTLAPYLDGGSFIKAFDREFDQELRARHNVHHHQRFVDIAIDRILLTDTITLNRDDRGWRQEHLNAYRKTANEWAGRVRQRGRRMDEWLELIAEVTLTTCVFLSDRSDKCARNGESPA